MGIKYLLLKKGRNRVENMVIFSVCTFSRWKTDDQWDKAFDLIDNFRKKYDLKIINSWGESHTVLNIRLGIYNIKFEQLNSGIWITLDTTTTKEDFDEKFDFIFRSIGRI